MSHMRRALNKTHILLFINHYFNKILKSDWLSTVLISALIGRCNRTVRTITLLRLNGCFSPTSKKITWNFLCFKFIKKPKISQINFCYSYD